jgi:hypothetical protein
MKRPLIAFIVAFALSLGFTFLTLATRASFLLTLQNNIAESLLANNLLSILFSFVGLAVFFVAFYFLAKNVKLTATKATVIAILLGTTIGPAFLNLFITLILANVTGISLVLAAGSAVSSIFQFFLPALTALLFAELRKNKSNNNPT